MTLRRVARPRLLDSPCLLENSRGCFREIALFPILLFFRFALRFGHVASCHRPTLREILKFKLTHYPFFDIGHAPKRLISEAHYRCSLHSFRCASSNAIVRSSLPVESRTRISPDRKQAPVLRIIDRLIFLRVSEIPSNLPTILPIF